MTQFQPPFEDDLVEPPRTSGLAVASLICSLICCLPLTTVLGALLGIGAMISIGGDPAKRGKGLALTGIVLGILFTIGQFVIYPKVYNFSKEMFQFVDHGATEALATAFNGDLVGFRSQFYGPGATATDVEVQEFLTELTDRYGQYHGGHFDPTREAQQTLGEPKVPFPYLLQFDSADVNAEAVVVFADPDAHKGFIVKMESIRILDDTRGDVVFPPIPGK